MLGILPKKRMITSDQYRESPLFQGRLEIRCELTVTMIATVRGTCCFKDTSNLSKLSMRSLKIKLLLAHILQKQIFSSFKQITGFVQRRKKSKGRGEKQTSVTY